MRHAIFNQKFRPAHFKNIEQPLKVWLDKYRAEFFMFEIPIIFSLMHCIGH